MESIRVLDKKGFTSIYDSLQNLEITFNSDEFFCLAKIIILERLHTYFVFMARDVAAPSGNIGSQFLLKKI